MSRCARKLSLRRPDVLSSRPSRIRALPQPQILPFDRILPLKRKSSHSAANTAILYLNSFTPEQSNLLAYLEEHSKRAPAFSFIVRYKPDDSREGESLRKKSSLGGYGVEMVLKRTDYLAVDDRATGGTCFDEADSS